MKTSGVRTITGKNDNIKQENDKRNTRQNKEAQAARNGKGL